MAPVPSALSKGDHMHRYSADLIVALVKLRKAVDTLQSGQPVFAGEERTVIPEYFGALRNFHEALLDILEVDDSVDADSIPHLQDCLDEALGWKNEAVIAALPPNDDDERLGASQLGVGRFR